MPLMSVRICEWFTAGHMTYQNSTTKPRKCNITAYSQRSVYSYVTYDKSQNVVNDHDPTGLPYKVT